MDKETLLKVLFIIEIIICINDCRCDDIRYRHSKGGKICQLCGFEAFFLC